MFDSLITLSILIISFDNNLVIISETHNWNIICLKINEIKFSLKNFLSQILRSLRFKNFKSKRFRTCFYMISYISFFVKNLISKKFQMDNFLSSNNNILSLLFLYFDMNRNDWILFLDLKFP